MEYELREKVDTIFLLSKEKDEIKRQYDRVSHELVESK